jgi:site-specific DNA-methyltransferase (adenine-specific)
VSEQRSSRYDEFNYQAGVVALKDILFGDRAREDYGDVRELAASYDEVGLIQPLAVKELEKPGSNGEKYILVAGGRRFLALLHSKKTSAMVRIYPTSVDDETLKTIEKLENALRKDMTWQEIAILDRQIHEMQVKRHGKKISTSPNAEGWSQASTAKLLNKSAATVSTNLELAKALDKHKDQLAKAKDRKSAVQTLRRIQHNEEQAKKADQLRKASVSNEDFKKVLEKCYMLGDALENLAKIPDNTFDLIEIDPPYAIDYKELKKDTTQVMEYNEIDQSSYLEFMKKIIQETYRCAKPDAWIILWYAIDPWHKPLNDLLNNAGWKVRSIPAIWYKDKAAGQTLQPERYLGRSYEPFFYGRKGEPIMNRRGRSDVYAYETPSASQRIHPTERPIPLMEDVLSTFASPGSSICSPFLGSGNTILAACNLSMHCIGFDLSKEYKDRFSIRVHEQQPGQYGKNLT